MLRIENLIAVIFSLCRLGNTQLAPIYPIAAQNGNPSISYVSMISHNLKEVSISNSHPLVQTFTFQFLNTFQNNPTWSLVFNIANIPGIEAGNAFQQMILQNLQRHGCPHADVLASHCFEGSLATFDAIDSKQYQIAFGRAYAKYLLHHGHLKLENALKLGKTLAEDIGRATLILNPVDNYGYTQAAINAGETFMNRFGLKLIDFAEESIDLFFKEVSCLAKGICS